MNVAAFVDGRSNARIVFRAPWARDQLQVVRPIVTRPSPGWIVPQDHDARGRNVGDRSRARLVQRVERVRNVFDAIADLEFIGHL